MRIASIFYRVAVGAAVFGAIGQLPSAAADTSAASPAAGTADKRPSFESGGIKASIANIALSKGRAIIQLALKNTSNNRQYFVVTGSTRLQFDSGNVTLLQNVSGAAYCNMNNNNDGDNAQACLNYYLDPKNPSIGYFSYIEPGELATVALEYRVDDSVENARTVSFSFRAIVRTATGHPDDLDTDLAKALGKPHVVNINFPLVSIKETQ